jgi:hypothetical protein
MEKVWGRQYILQNLYQVAPPTYFLVSEVQDIYESQILHCTLKFRHSLKSKILLYIEKKVVAPLNANNFPPSVHFLIRRDSILIQLHLLTMSAKDEKTQGDGHVEDLSPNAATKDTEALESLRGTDALMVAIRIEPVQKLGKGMIQLYAICALIMLGASIGGYDASLMGNLLDMPHFQSRFGASILGVKAGLISSMFSIGSACALPFIGPCADTWGRRAGIAMGCSIIIMGTIVQGTAHRLPQYLAGRFSLGFGGGIARAGPAYVVEIAHPVYRGVIAGLFNYCYYVGAILAAVVLRGYVHYDLDKPWMIPTWFQMALPTILLIGCFFIPESPRWQYSHGQIEKCRTRLIKYHGNGNPDSVYVQLQMQEFGAWIELDGSDKR